MYPSLTLKYNASLRNDTLYIDQNVSQVSVLLKKPGYFSLNMDILKSPKHELQTVSLLFESAFSSIEVFWGCFWIIRWLMPAYSFFSTKQKIYYLMAVCGLWRFYHVTEADVDHLQLCKLISAISPTLFSRR